MRLMKVKEFADAIGVSRQSIYKKIKLGYLPVVEINVLGKKLKRIDMDKVIEEYPYLKEISELDHDERVTPSEIAKALRLSRATVYRMIEKGEIPAKVVGSANSNLKYYIKKGDLVSRFDCFEKNI